MPNGNRSSRKSASLPIENTPPVLRRSGTREIGIVVFDDALLLDATGPADVFSRANHHLQQPGEPDRYRITALSTFGGEIATSSGLRLQTAALPAPDICAFDTLVVAGGPGVLNARHDLQLRNWLLAVQPRVRRIGSVCTGAYVLAECGLFSGRAATTHWGHADRFARLYPDVRLDVDALIVRDDKYFSSGGATAGIDLTLALVDEDHGRALALAIARELVVYRVRSAGQTQKSAALVAYQGSEDRLRRATDYVLAHLENGVSVEQVAAHVCLGTRQLGRVFQDGLGMSPARYIAAAQVELAKELLVSTNLPVEKIAVRCGFSGRQQLGRVFERVFGVAVGEFRQKAPSR
jgi:transcriptional regulator GlxA family with amidase domain